MKIRTILIGYVGARKLLRRWEDTQPFGGRMALLKWKRLQHRQIVKGGEIRIVVQRREASGVIQLQHIMKKRAFLRLTFVRKRAAIRSMATRRHLGQYVSHFALYSEDVLTDSAGAGFAPCRAA
jgi:hypothetical protein